MDPANVNDVKLVKIVAGLFAAWLVLLVIIGLAGGRSMEKRVIARVGEPLQATVTIDKTELALIRGFLDLKKLAVKRDDQIAIDIDEVRCDLPILGLALIDGDCKTLAIQKMRVKISALGAFHVRNAKSPVRADRVVIDDAILELSPSAIASGLGKVTITVEHAESKSTVFKTPLSWIFALDKLKAKLELPGEVVVQLGYTDGKLTLAGGLFGSKPIELPFAIPVQALDEDPVGELKRLAKLGKDIAEQALLQKGKDWIQSIHP